MCIRDRCYSVGVFRPSKLPDNDTGNFCQVALRVDPYNYLAKGLIPFCSIQISLHFIISEQLEVLQNIVMIFAKVLSV